MAEKIKIDFVSDVVCPWCIIGYKRLEQAISEMGIQDKVEIEWQPFELNPNVPAEGEDRQEYRIRKYGISAADGAVAEAQMTERGAELGFKFDYYDGMRVVNTGDAHILLDYAKEFGKQTELKMRLFVAFFSERKDVSDRKILSQEFQTVGLNAEEISDKLPEELSGGMQRRVAIGRALLSTDPKIMLYDEPTTGLHFDDTKKLLEVLGRLVDVGNTVVVIEHNMDVIKTADWIIDLGPEGGDNGGRVVVSGTPEEVAKWHKESYTGKYLKKVLAK